MTQYPIYGGGMKEAHILHIHNTVTLSETREAYQMGKSVLHTNGLKPMAFGTEGRCFTSLLPRRRKIHKRIGNGEISRRKVKQGIRNTEVSAM